MDRAYSIEAFGRFVAGNPQVAPPSYIDDDSVTASGTEQEVLANINQAAACLRILFRDELR
eukprot:6776484-Pyramimonas_sp.AAC.1